MGYFDNERGRVEPDRNPVVRDKLLTLRPEFTPSIERRCFNP